jgi:hypothetical protein
VPDYCGKEQQQRDAACWDTEPDAVLKARGVARLPAFTLSWCFNWRARATGYAVPDKRAAVDEAARQERAVPTSSAVTEACAVNRTHEVAR